MILLTLLALLTLRLQNRSFSSLKVWRMVCASRESYPGAASRVINRVAIMPAWIRQATA